MPTRLSKEEMISMRVVTFTGIRGLFHIVSSKVDIVNQIWDCIIVSKHKEYTRLLYSLDPEPNCEFYNITRPYKESYSITSPKKLFKKLELDILFENYFTPYYINKFI